MDFHFDWKITQNETNPISNAITVIKIKINIKH